MVSFHELKGAGLRNYHNRPLPSSKNPHIQNEVHNLSCENEFYLHEKEK